ncbi:MAG: hypothetical protein V2A78_12275 [bacterium]
MAHDNVSHELDRLTSDGSGYGDPQAQLFDDRKFQILMKAYETAVETRKLEIELFWSRSLFFWGFIASAFIAYAELHRFGSDISVVIASFGLVCSLAWSLGNRGSKFWQESWETKVERIEPSVTGALFSRPESVQTRKGSWLCGREFSVSKLAIALSDYTIVLWFSVIVWELFCLLAPSAVVVCVKPYAVLVFVAFSLLFCVVVFFAGRSTLRPDPMAPNPPLNTDVGNKAARPG